MAFGARMMTSFSREPEGLPSWRRQRSGPFHIAAHPDLTVVQVRRDGRTLTLLGYLLDPKIPTAADPSSLFRLRVLLSIEVGKGDIRDLES